MYVGVELIAIIVAIALALLAQVVLSIRSESKQAQIQARTQQALSDLSKSVASFTKDTQRRFDTQDQILRGHADRLTDHSSDIGYLKGRVFPVGVK